MGNEAITRGCRSVRAAIREIDETKAMVRLYLEMENRPKATECHRRAARLERQALRLTVRG